MDMREYIINNFKEDSIEDIKKSIIESIKSKDEDTLFGMGVLFELLWNNSDDELKDKILKNIKLGLTK